MLRNRDNVNGWLPNGASHHIVILGEQSNWATPFHVLFPALFFIVKSRDAVALQPFFFFFLMRSSLPFNRHGIDLIHRIVPAIHWCSPRFLLNLRKLKRKPPFNKRYYHKHNKWLIYDIFDRVMKKNWLLFSRVN